ncbi:MAG: S8 family serine peptidase [Candidatus Doudnabacteria bacterium]|nr:S8 family serine peptidase [Candidatus Doudnabacteria bacterium]
MNAIIGKYFRKLSLAAAVWLIGLSAMPVLALAQNSPQSNGGGFYTVQLKSAADFSSLLNDARNIHHVLFSNQSPEFKNIYTFDSNESLAQLKTLWQGQFNYLEPEMRTQSAGIVVNDPGFSTNPLDIDKEWGLLKAGFDQAWQKTTGSQNNIVAVIDTGIDETHQDLKTINFVPGFNFVSQQSILPGTNSDDNGHGTLVTGVLGATANNGLGIVGTNWQITVMPVKALDNSGQGDAATLAQAIIWAADHGAQFINLSVGGVGFGHDTTLANAISYAFNKNVLIVSAAGNDLNVTGQSLDQDPVFPICDDNNYNMVIGVAATDQNDQKADFSNYGHNCIDVSAPGKRILSTINIDPTTKKPSPNSYAYASGTSLAVPFVVGQAALIRALYPTATNIQIRDRIISTADSIDSNNSTQCGGSSCSGLLGSGRIDVPASLQTAITQKFGEGSLVKAQDLGVVYDIIGGQKRMVSPFVFNQRFSDQTVIISTSEQIASYPEGAYLTPLDGTLVKYDANPTVYIMENGQKLPVTYAVYLEQGMNQKPINTLSYAELSSWPTGSFLPPTDGTLVRGQSEPTVYWVIGQQLHPINYGFYIERGLNIFPLMIVPDSDIQSYPQGESYIR